ncbi:MAG TPA: DNA primase [Alphaproteobacteria bacterium]|jgi:DNA primase
MAFDPSFLDEMRNRLNIADVVARRVKLVKRGREHTGLCPFHNEKSPSFTVSEDKGFFHCFGCGAHGDVIGFVMRTENMSFPEAVERLAGEAGLQIPNMTREEREEGQKRQTLHAVVEAAAQWFMLELVGPRGRPGRDYLAKRGMQMAAIERFRIGFAPESRGALKAALLKQGFDEQLILDAGLIRKRESDGETYDLFRSRIIFPITDRRGRVIAFGGRVLDPAPEGAPKYLNSPETPLFHKGRNLYGYAQAMEGARKENLLVVTEGYMDAIAALSAGVPAVAPLGTALTEDQMRELWRLVPEPTLCFDGDSAGMRAAARAADRALPLIVPGRTLRFVGLPNGEDPDSLIGGQGVAAFRALLAASKPLSQLLWELATGGGGADTPEKVAVIEKTLMDQAGKVADPTLKKHYQDHFRDRVRQDLRMSSRAAGARQAGGGGNSGYGAPQRGFTNRGVPGRFGAGGFGAGRFGANKGYGASSLGLGPGAPVAPPDPLGRGEQGEAGRRERVLLATVLHHPEILSEVTEELAHILLESRDLDSLRLAIIEVAAEREGGMHSASGVLDAGALRDHLTERGFLSLIERLCGAQAGAGESFVRPEADAADALQGWRYVLDRHRLAELKAEIRAAEAAYAGDPSDENWTRLEALINEKNRGASDEADLERHG